MFVLRQISEIVKNACEGVRGMRREKVCERVLKKEKTCSAISCRLLRKSNNSKCVQICLAFERMRENQIYVKVIINNQINVKVINWIMSENGKRVRNVAIPSDVPLESGRLCRIQTCLVWSSRTLFSLHDYPSLSFRVGRTSFFLLSA